MDGHYSRRRVLQACAVGLGVGVAGCVGYTGYGAAPEQSETTNACKLSHEVWEEGKYGGYHGEEVEFSELSEQGQQIFKKTLESGGYVFPFNGTNNPPDFSYSDATSVYNVTYQSQQYVLLTSTGEGCVIE